MSYAGVCTKISTILTYAKLIKQYVKQIVGILTHANLKMTTSLK